MKMRLIVCSFVLLVLLNSAHVVQASASDNASNYSTFTNGSNGGTGFGSWAIINSYGAGAFLGSPPAQGLSPAFVSEGKAWGLDAIAQPNGFFSVTQAARQFSQGALHAGQTFSVDFYGGNGTGGYIALDTKDSSPGFILGPDIFALSGDNYYISNDGEDWFNGWTNTGISTSNSIHVLVTVGVGGSYSMLLSSLTSPQTYLYTNTTDLALNTFYSEADASGATEDPNGGIYFNNLGIDVPEPGTTLGICLMLGLVLRRRR